MQRIGLSTGMLYQVYPEKSLAARVDHISRLPFPLNAPAIPIELHIASPEQLNQPDYEALKFSLLMAGNRLFYHRISIHAPSQIEYPSRQAQEILPKLKELEWLSNSTAMIFHPDVVTDPAYVHTNFPNTAAAENLDRSKTTGRTPLELSPFAQEGFNFVIDLNHAQSMGGEVPHLLQSLLDFMGNRLKEAHISGLTRQRNSHCLYTHNGVNSQAELIKIIPQQVPLIHEGVLNPHLTSNTIDLLSNELQFLDQFAS